MKRILLENGIPYALASMIGSFKMFEATPLESFDMAAIAKTQLMDEPIFENHYFKIIPINDDIFVFHFASKRFVLWNKSTSSMKCSFHKYRKILRLNNNEFLTVPHDEESQLQRRDLDGKKCGTMDFPFINLQIIGDLFLARDAKGIAVFSWNRAPRRVYSSTEPAEKMYRFHNQILLIMRNHSFKVLTFNDNWELMNESPEHIRPVRGYPLPLTNFIFDGPTHFFDPKTCKMTLLKETYHLYGTMPLPNDCVLGLHHQNIRMVDLKRQQSLVLKPCTVSYIWYPCTEGTVFGYERNTATLTIFM